MKQLQAGFYLEGIRKLFTIQSTRDKVDALLQHLSFFEFESNSKFEAEDSDSVLMVVNNLITRGVPTRASTFIEDIFSTTFSRTRKTIDKEGNIDYFFTDQDIAEQIYKSLHIIDPRIKKENICIGFENPVTEKEKLFNEFYYNLLTDIAGNHFLQLFERDREYGNILNYTNNSSVDNTIFLNNPDYPFLSDKADLSLEMPYYVNNVKGLTLEFIENSEIDTTNYLLENKKKEFLNQLKWADPVRFRKTDFSSESDNYQAIQNFSYNEYFDLLLKNYKTPVYKTNEGLDALQISLTPIAIARLQKTILEFIRYNHLLLNTDAWNIAVIERDVPCAFLAFEDLKQHFTKLFLLEGKNRKFPKVNLTIFHTEEFEKSELNVLYQGNVQLIDQFPENEIFDLVVDISVLQRYGINCDEEKSAAKHYVKIRSIQSIKSENKYLLGDKIEYRPLFFTNETKTEEQLDLEFELNDALKFFLKNIFRKNDFLEAQLAFLNQILQNKSCLCVQPAASGKTIASQLLAMLQPALTFVVNPTTLVMREQFDNMRNAKIDGCLYLNTSYKKMYEKQQAIKKLKNCESLIIYITPEQLTESDTKNILHELAESEIKTGYFIVDEVHCMSMHSSDYRINYQNIVNFTNYFYKSNRKLDLTFIGLTASNATDVLSDVCKSFPHITFSRVDTTENKWNFNLNVIYVNIENQEQNADYKKTLKNVAGRKQVALNQKLEECFLAGNQSEKNRKILIYCNHNDGYEGVTDINGDGFSEKIQMAFPSQPISKFTGTIEEEFLEISPIQNSESIENHKNFCSGKSNLMIANSVYGCGINLYNTDQIIFTGYPGSFDFLVQQLTRGSRENKNVIGSILYNNQLINFKTEELLKNADGEYILGEINTETTVDKLLQKKLIQKRFPGQVKEELLINELLSNITYPLEKSSEIMQKRVLEIFGENILFTPQPAVNPYMLQVTKQNNRQIGYIDFRNNTIQVTSSAFEKDLSQRILYFLLSEIVKLSKNSESVFAWFDSDYIRSYNNGVEQCLQKLNNGEKSSLIISFTNNKIQKTVDLLKQYSSEKFTAEIVLKAWKSAISVTDFFDNLKQTASINLINQTINLPETIKRLFYEIRNKYQTLLAINRLAIIGVIDDFTVSQSTGYIEIFFSKKDNQEYLNNLYSYISRFISADKAAKICKDLEFVKSDSFIKTCAFELIRFIYNDIVNTKLQEIENMDVFFDTICKKQNTDLELNKKISLFLKSRNTLTFTNNLFQPSLLIDTNNFIVSNFKVIDKYVNLIGYNKTKWSQLKQSTEFLMKEFPSNPVLLILNSYSTLLMANTDAETLKHEAEKMINGLRYLQTEERLPVAQFNDRLEEMLYKIYEQNSEIEHSMKPLMELKKHTEWLKSFNTRFLLGYKNSRN